MEGVFISSCIADCFLGAVVEDSYIEFVLSRRLLLFALQACQPFALERTRLAHGTRTHRGGAPRPAPQAAEAAPTAAVGEDADIGAVECDERGAA